MERYTIGDCMFVSSLNVYTKALVISRMALGDGTSGEINVGGQGLKMDLGIIGRRQEYFLLVYKGTAIHL